MPEMRVVSLQNLVTRLFESHGAPCDLAEGVSAHLVRADRAGHPSHGVIRVGQYIDEIRNGVMIPDATPVMVRETPASALVDGRHGFGFGVASYALELGIKKARAMGLAAVATIRSRHVGRVGDFTERAADQGLIGMAWGNGQRSPGFVAPFGGRQARHGTNPIAMAVPRGAGKPAVVADFATSIAAEGKVRVALNRGQQVNPRWIMDRDGNATSDPRDLYDGGALRPFGEHKGYCLSFMCDVLAGVLSGALTPVFPEYEGSNSLAMIFLNPECFRANDEFQQDVDRFCDIVGASPPENGFDEVVVPGELELRRLAANRETLSVDEPTWQTLCQLAAERAIEIPKVQDAGADA